MNRRAFLAALAAAPLAAVAAVRAPAPLTSWDAIAESLCWDDDEPFRMNGDDGTYISDCAGIDHEVLAAVTVPIALDSKWAYWIDDDGSLLRFNENNHSWVGYFGVPTVAWLEAHEAREREREAAAREDPSPDVREARR